jgi:hypothetical protein
MERTNTGVDDTILHEKLILCCGEDATELLSALPVKLASLAHHQYRCYRFWRFPHFTLAWSGMGTGCLEPLLYELVYANDEGSSRKQIREILLIGTAGAFPGTTLAFGQPYLIRKAYLGASAISVAEHEVSAPQPQPLAPNLLEMRDASLKEASVVSTDYYYGFSMDLRSQLLRQADARLAKAVSRAWGKVDMVDMETAQFYHLCSLSGRTDLGYAAVRGPSNHIDNFPMQRAYSLPVLQSALSAAFRLLSLD